MARYKSILQFQGSIDGLVFYELNGVSVVRKKSGFNRDDFKTKENYARVRENSSEFGHCSKTGKMLRNAIYPYYKKCGDRYLYQKFAQLMTAIKNFDSVSERGKRTVYQGLDFFRAQYATYSTLSAFGFYFTELRKLPF